MKASELVKKLGSKLLGKKVNTLAAGGVATVIQTEAEVKVPEILLLDRLGVIQLHENWRN
jgi:ABC-type molybdenum transport system ATPase subunit/photorepair protein PhrA